MSQTDRQTDGGYFKGPNCWSNKKQKEIIVVHDCSLLFTVVHVCSWLKNNAILTILRIFFEQSAKNTFFDKKLFIKKIGTPGAHGVNTKVVDINKIYLNMENEQNPESHFRTNGLKPRFWPNLETKWSKLA